MLVLAIFFFLTFIILYLNSPALRLFIIRLRILDKELSFFSKSSKFLKLCTFFLYFSAMLVIFVCILLLFNMLFWVDLILFVYLFSSSITLIFFISDLLIRFYNLCFEFKTLSLDYSELLLLCSFFKTLIKFTTCVSSSFFILFLIYDIYIRNFLSMDTGFCVYQFSPLLTFLFFLQNVLTFDQFLDMILNPYNAIFFFAERRIKLKREILEIVILKLERGDILSSNNAIDKKNCQKALYYLDQEVIRLNNLKKK